MIPTLPQLLLAIWAQSSHTADTLQDSHYASLSSLHINLEPLPSLYLTQFQAHLTLRNMNFINLKKHPSESLLLQNHSS
jgi:hypothetical protein